MLPTVFTATKCGFSWLLTARMLKKLSPVYSGGAAARHISLSSALNLKQISVTTEDNRTVIEGQYLESPRSGKLIRLENPKELCPLCPSNLGVEVKYTDVLILSQFIHADGEVLPQEVTKLCHKQHRKLLKLVEQAHRAGLLPDYRPDIDEKEELAPTDLKWRKYNAFFTS